MGGKSRKSGGVSRKLIQQIKSGVCGKVNSIANTRIKRFLIEDEEDINESTNKKLSGKSKKNRC